MNPEELITYVGAWGDHFHMELHGAYISQSLVASDPRKAWSQLFSHAIQKMSSGTASATRIIFHCLEIAHLIVDIESIKTQPTKSMPILFLRCIKLPDKENKSQENLVEASREKPHLDYPCTLREIEYGYEVLTEHVEDMSKSFVSSQKEKYMSTMLRANGSPMSRDPTEMSGNEAYLGVFSQYSYILPPTEADTSPIDDSVGTTISQTQADANSSKARLQMISGFKTDPAYADTVLCHLSGCPRLVSLMCGRCLTTFYCCEDHRQKHWSLEGHRETCIPAIKFDPNTDPIPGTMGATAKPPEDHWNPELNSICFDLKLCMNGWKHQHTAEHKHFLVKCQLPLLGEGPYSLYNKESTIIATIKPSQTGYDKLMKASTHPNVKQKKLFFRARRHGDFLRVYYETPFSGEVEW